jgi:hypothetical protein
MWLRGQAAVSVPARGAPQRRKSTGGAKGPSASVRRALQGSGEPLPAGTRAQMESRFGHSFGGVRVAIPGARPPSPRAPWGACLHCR